MSSSSSASSKKNSPEKQYTPSRIIPISPLQISRNPQSAAQVWPISNAKVTATPGEQNNYRVALTKEQYLFLNCLHKKGIFVTCITISFSIKLFFYFLFRIEEKKRLLLEAVNLFKSKLELSKASISKSEVIRQINILAGGPMDDVPLLEKPSDLVI